MGERFSTRIRSSPAACWRVGCGRWEFAALPADLLACGLAGDLEPLIHTALVSHHLIELTRDCQRGTGESPYLRSDRRRARHPPEAAPV
jgi:hypothetical protein